MVRSLNAINTSSMGWRDSDSVASANSASSDGAAAAASAEAGTAAASVVAPTAAQYGEEPADN